MKKVTTILGIAAVAGVAYKVLTHKKADGSTLLDELTEAGKGLADKFNEFADSKSDWKDKINAFVDKVKDKLMPDLKGPNGEEVYSDMYHRNYYSDGQGGRVYLDEA